MEPFSQGDAVQAWHTQIRDDGGDLPRVPLELASRVYAIGCQQDIQTIAQRTRDLISDQRLIVHHENSLLNYSHPL